MPQEPRRLPIIEIQNPCPVPTTDMLELDGRRVMHCFDCERSVYNLSLMTEDEAFALLEDKKGTGEVCLQFYRRADGTVQTLDCSRTRLDQMKRHTTRATRRAIAFSTVIIGALLAMAGVSSLEPVPSEKRTEKRVDEPPPPVAPRPAPRPHRSDHSSYAGGVIL